MCTLVLELQGDERRFYGPLIRRAIHTEVDIREDWELRLREVAAAPDSSGDDVVLALQRLLQLPVPAEEPEQNPGKIITEANKHHARLNFQLQLARSFISTQIIGLQLERLLLSLFDDESPSLFPQNRGPPAHSSMQMQIGRSFFQTFRCSRFL